jgi:hypothetical protein
VSPYFFLTDYTDEHRLLVRKKIKDWFEYFAFVNKSIRLRCHRHPTGLYKTRGTLRLPYKITSAPFFSVRIQEITIAESPMSL